MFPSRPRRGIAPTRARRPALTLTLVLFASSLVVSTFPRGARADADDDPFEDDSYDPDDELDYGEALAPAGAPEGAPVAPGPEAAPEETPAPDDGFPEGDWVNSGVVVNFLRAEGGPAFSVGRAGAPEMNIRVALDSVAELDEDGKKISARSKYVNLVGSANAPEITASTTTALIGDPPVLAVVVNMTLSVDPDMPCAKGDGAGAGAFPGGNAAATRPLEPLPNTFESDREETVDDLEDPDVRGNRGGANDRGGSGDASGPGAGARRRALSAVGDRPTVSLVTYLFTDPTNVTFGELVLDVPASGVKFNLEARRWPFCDAGASLAVELDVKESSPDREKVKFEAAPGSKRKRRRVEMEAGAIEFPEIAIADGAQTEIIVDARQRGVKRTVEFVFPRFEESLVYDPTLTIHSEEESRRIVDRAESEGTGGDGDDDGDGDGDGGENVDEDIITVMNMDTKSGGRRAVGVAFSALAALLAVAP